MNPQMLIYRNSYSFSKPTVNHNAHFRYEKCLDASMIPQMLIYHNADFRYEKCLDVGMSPHMVLSEEEKKVIQSFQIFCIII
jgi:hypothetical protein